MITASVRAAMGEPITDVSQKPYNGHWAEIILHADRTGKFETLEIKDSFKSFVEEKDLWVSKGDKVNAFVGANDAIGTLVMKFETSEQLEYALANQQEWLKVIVR